MEKIGRNDACPCGSGKKYKHCHWNKKEAPVTPPAMENSSESGFTGLLKNHNSIQILGLLAALQLHPENHGRNVRFEQLCRETLLQFYPEDKKQLASWDQLKEVIENYTEGSHEEDPLTNAFTETAIFEGGNYITYPGIYAGFTEILNQLTECIFLIKNDLNKEFLKNVRDAIGLLLFMSDSVARDVGHVAYIYRKGDNRNTDTLIFNNDFLNKVCEHHGYDKAILDDFILKPGAEELQNDDTEENVVNFKPIITLKDAVLLYMPTGVLNALITFIYRKAKEYKCYDELLDIFYARQFQLSCVALGNTNWIATDIKLPLHDGSLTLREMVFQIDNQKFGYVCFVQPNKNVIEDFAVKPDKKATDPYLERTNEVVQYLSGLTDIQFFGILCLYIIAESGQDFIFAWPKPSIGNQSLALTYKELYTISHSSNVNSLTLWKFAKCYNRTNELTKIKLMGGLLDAYTIYRENHGSLMHSDEANPIGGMLMILNGSSDDFRREVQKQQNEHAVPIFYKGQLAYAKVIRYKDYAPIYVEREVSACFRIVIESYKMPIWVTNPQTRRGKESLGTYSCEAVAFWLNKMTLFLVPYLNELRLIQFEIEVKVADEILNPGPFEAIPFVPEDIVITNTIIPPKICISIPFEYIYAVILPDNTADKMLMKAVLQGMLNYIQASGNKTELNVQIIDGIIDNTLQPTGAKMLLFSNASLNIKMDDRNLPPLRYINESDVSYILDNLVSYLPKGYTVPSDIPDTKDKIKLCDDNHNTRPWSYPN